MSDRRAQARKVLAKLAAEIGAWPEWKSDEVFQKALVDIAADEAVAEIVAQFGDKIPITRHFAMRARRPAEEEAVGRMMFIVRSLSSNGARERDSQETRRMGQCGSKGDSR